MDDTRLSGNTGTWQRASKYLGTFYATGSGLATTKCQVDRVVGNSLEGPAQPWSSFVPDIVLVASLFKCRTLTSYLPFHHCISTEQLVIVPLLVVRSIGLSQQRYGNDFESEPVRTTHLPFAFAFGIMYCPSQTQGLNEENPLQFTTGKAGRI